MTLRPSCHWPRFFSSSTRSKRFSTLRFATIVLVPLRLRCWDMGLKMSAKPSAKRLFFKSAVAIHQKPLGL
jgi:hypothetical protein